jgi:hypothetical protein
MTSVAVKYCAEWEKADEEILEAVRVHNKRAAEKARAKAAHIDLCKQAIHKCKTHIVSLELDIKRNKYEFNVAKIMLQAME